MSDKRSLLNGNNSMFSQNAPQRGPSSAAAMPPADGAGTSTPAPEVVKKTPRQQVKFYAEQEPYEEFKRAHRLLQVYDESLGSLSDHLNRLMVEETARINREHGGAGDRAS